MSTKDVTHAPSSVSASRRGLWQFLTAHPVLVDAMVASGYILVLLPGLVHSAFLPDPEHAWQGPLALAATLGNGGALLLRRRSPIVVLTAAIILVLVVKTLICGTLDPLGVALAGYAAGAHLPPRKAWISLPAAVVLVVLIIVFGAPMSAVTVGIDSLLIINLVLMVPACLLGLLVRVLSSLRESEERRLVQAQYEREQEAELTAVRTRTTLSRDMHDVVGHSLTAIINISDGALRLSGTRPEVSDESLQRINKLARDALGETRAILGTLRPDGQTAPRAPALIPHALPPAGSDHEIGDASLGVQELLATAESTGLTARMVIHGNPPPDALGDDVRVGAHRIVQEATTNVMRHADGASEVIVTITHTADAMTIQVHDDGRNADQATPGNGLRGAAERAESLGGQLNSGPAPAGGWHVTAVLPYRRAEP